MILTDRQIVWTPTLGPKSLTISLDRKFAGACANFKADDLPHLMKQIWRRIENPPRHMPSNFLDVRTGIFPHGIYLEPGNGLWLEVDTTTLAKDSKRPILFHGKNENLMPDRYTLMSAFGAWANAATILLDW